MVNRDNSRKPVFKSHKPIEKEKLNSEYQKKPQRNTSTIRGKEMNNRDTELKQKHSQKQTI